MACLPLRGVAASGLPLQQCAQGARRIRSLFTAPAPSSSPFAAPVPSSTRVSASPAIATLPFFPWDDSQCSACQWEGSRRGGRAAGPEQARAARRVRWDPAHCTGFWTDDLHCERPRVGSLPLGPLALRCCALGSLVGTSVKKAAPGSEPWSRAFKSFPPSPLGYGLT